MGEQRGVKGKRLHRGVFKNGRFIFLLISLFLIMILKKYFSARGFCCQPFYLESRALFSKMKIIDLKFEPHHIPVLAGWHHGEWSYLNPNWSFEQREKDMRLHLTDDLVPSTFVALEDQLLGSAAIIEHDMDTRPDLSPWLASVFVAPEYRCKGVGSKLVMHVMKKAKEAGIPVLYLFTPDKERFYQKLGWQTISNETYRGHLVPVMRVNLIG
jgi:N-acetylglutamate synthase-like GNAT family acetyltransferase